MRKLRSLSVLAVWAVMLTVGTAWSASNASAHSSKNGHAALIHVGLNPPCGTMPGPASGVVNVHFNPKRDRLMINVSVHNAQPNTTYVVDLRCIGEIGSLTTNSQGTGTAHIKLENMASPPAGDFYVDISIKGAGGGIGGYGDTFIAGPFNLD